LPLALHGNANHNRSKKKQQGQLQLENSSSCLGIVDFVLGWGYLGSGFGECCRL
jgi:hypothetical protein